MCGQPTWNQGARGRRSRLGYLAGPPVQGGLQVKVGLGCECRWCPQLCLGSSWVGEGPDFQDFQDVCCGGMMDRGQQLCSMLASRWGPRSISGPGDPGWGRGIKEHSCFSRIWAARELTQQWGVGALPGGSRVDSVMSEGGRAGKGSGYVVADSPCPDVCICILSGLAHPSLPSGGLNWCVLYEVSRVSSEN